MKSSALILLTIGALLAGCAQKIQCLPRARIKPICDPRVERLLVMVEAGLMPKPSPYDVLAMAECIRLHEAAY